MIFVGRDDKISTDDLFLQKNIEQIGDDIKDFTPACPFIRIY